MKCFLAIAFVFALPISASTITSALTGRITSAGKPVAGATVTLTSEALQHERISRTGSYGTYWLTALPPGVYEVTFAAKGMQTITRRATIELARVSRADAVLEPSEDEENVTSTARTVSVVDTTTVTTHFSDFVLDRLPVRRLAGETSLLAPGPWDYHAWLDGSVHVTQTFFLGEESTEQITHLRAAGPIEDHRGFGDISVTRMRSGGNDFFLSLRDSVTHDHGSSEHLFEGAAGGRIVRDRLWFFAGGWTGDDLFFFGPVRGYAAKLNAQVGASHSFVATGTGTRIGADLIETGATITKKIAAVQYTGAISPRVTVEATASRVFERWRLPRITRSQFDRDALLAKATYVLPSSAGDHVLTAGGATSDTTGRGYAYDETVLFFNDRWAHDRWVVEAGVRKQSFASHEYHPRFAAVYDIRGNGRHAASVTYASYEEPLSGRSRQLTIGYGAALGSSGSFRADLLRTERGAEDEWGVQVDAAYRLFDRLTTGANYAYTSNGDYASQPAHVANGWLSIDFPVGAHVLGATVLQRYRDIPTTDLGLRYRLPAGRTMLTFAGDLTNIFNDTSTEVWIGRALRLWVRLRL